MSNEYLFFCGFLLFVIIMLALDLGIFNRKDHSISFSQAGVMSFVWVLLAIVFYFVLFNNGHLLHNIDTPEQLNQIVKKHRHHIDLISESFVVNVSVYNQNLALEFLTGYLIEYALSVDNIFIIILIFTGFNVEVKYYHRVLFWGIVGAVFMRFIFIFLGATLISQFDWILYIFGAFLIYTGIMLLFDRSSDKRIDPNNHTIVKLASKCFSVYPGFAGNKFFIRKDGKTLVTSLFLVLLIVEFTDLIFAIDSIPAIFSVTKDPYIVFFSNIFAILGLRSMFFLLVNVIHQFHYLRFGLVILLIFVGTKMLLHHWLPTVGFTITHSLFIILIILTASIVVSLLFPVHHTSKDH